MATISDPQGILNPEDFNFFSSSRRRVNDTYGLGLAQNTYNQDVTRNAYSRSLGNLTRQFEQMRARLPGTYARRGLLNSGIYQKRLTDFQGDQSRAFANAAGAFNDQMMGFQLGGQQLEQVRRSTLDDVDMQEQARRAAVAALLAAR